MINRRSLFLTLGATLFILVLVTVIVKGLIGQEVQQLTDKKKQYAINQFVNFKDYPAGDNPFPEEIFYDPSGKKVTINDYAGQYVLLNFWATWCPGCVKELPSLKKLEQKFQEKQYPITVIGLNVDRQKTGTEIANFIFEHDIGPFALYHDRDKKVSLAYEIGGMPTTFLIDPKGNIIYEFLGEADWMNYAIFDLLAEDLETFMAFEKLNEIKETQEKEE